MLELLRRAAVPIVPTLEEIGVEIERPWDMTLLVLLRNAEIDVEEQELAGRRRLRPLSIEQLPQPVGVDKLVVVR